MSKIILFIAAVSLEVQNASKKNTVISTREKVIGTKVYKYNKRCNKESNKDKTSKFCQGGLIQDGPMPAFTFIQESQR